MRSHGKGSLSATTQVKVLSPEIVFVALGQGFHILEANIGMHVNGECMFDMPGSESVAGKRTVYVGTWENRIAPKGSDHEAEEVTRTSGVSVVGLTHSRGVGRVMPVASYFSRHSKGSALIRRDDLGHSPISELEITVSTLQRLIPDLGTRYVAIVESINEEPDEGNLQVRFCEGHGLPRI